MPAHVPPVADERDGLLAFLGHQREAVKRTVHGLRDDQLRATPSASGLSLGGLLKHLAQCERSWIARVRGEQWAQSAERYLDGFRTAGTDTLGSLVGDYDAAAEETGKAIAAVDDLGQPVPVPRGVPWMPQDVDAWSVRWVLLHLIEETARHAGHADVIRESLDGATAVSLLAAVEQWPATDWVQPWTPEGDR